MSQFSIGVKSFGIQRSMGEGTLFISLGSNTGGNDLVFLHFENVQALVEFANDVKEEAQRQYANKFELLGDE